MRGIGRFLAFGLTVAVVSTGLVSERLPAEAALGAVGSGRSGTLEAVAADSATDAWAVGFTGDLMSFPDESLVLHWNGLGWTKVATPNPSGTTASSANFLYGVSAVSPVDAWAVGYYRDVTTSVWHTLILHWNGSKWTRVKSPSPPGGPGQGSFLLSVSADSSTDAWAVGQVSNGANHTLVLHWDGTSWARISSPNPGGTISGSENSLASVSAVSGTDAWAAGDFGNSTSHADQTLVEHWNGTSWRVTASPSPGGTTSSNQESVLRAISAVAGVHPAAVGWYNPDVAQTLALQRSSRRWGQLSTPNPGLPSSSYLWGVSERSASDAWAVGDYANPAAPNTVDTLVLHNDGTGWAPVASPNPAGTTTGENQLSGVKSLSARDAWAVGSYFDSSTQTWKTLLLHWDGSTWTNA